MPIEDTTEEAERERRIRNNQLKLQWELKCQKITEAGILCGERPWNLCDLKCVSLLYLSFGTEGRRLLTQKFPHDNIYDLTTLKLWEMMEIAFIRPRNITFDRYVFFSRKQKKGETRRAILQHLDRIGWKLRLWKPWRSDHQGNFHHEHVGWWHSARAPTGYSWTREGTQHCSQHGNGKSESAKNFI